MRMFVFSWFIWVALCSALRAEDVLIFAAASLAGPLDQIAGTFEDETGATVTISYGASSTLARQVQLGAPADVVILANEAWMDHLATHGALMEGTRRTLLENRLVLIGSARTPDAVMLQDLPQILGGDRVAIALSEAVPAGIYARAALENMGLWEDPRVTIVEADNVRAAQMLVAIGAARFGIVYATDVAQEPRVAVLSEIPEDLHPPIRYPVGVVRDAGLLAERFVSHLASPGARGVFTDAGYGMAVP